MTQPFDPIAEQYDKDFSNTETGKLLRKHVREYLSDKILKDQKLNVLEINCGTGEDAIWFHQAGHTVLATDISAEMIRIAGLKAGRAGQPGISFMQMGFGDFPGDDMKEKFDLVFSNFGGLNCIPPDKLKELITAIYGMLKPEGRFIGVVMPKYCFWEIIYFIIKGSGEKAFRRNKNGAVTINLSGQPVITWFYSPSMIKRIAEDFSVKGICPVGIALPPPFMENFFTNRKKLLVIFDRIESVLNNLPVLAGYADHFLFDLKKNPNLPTASGDD